MKRPDLFQFLLGLVFGYLAMDLVFDRVGLAREMATLRTERRELDRRLDSVATAVQRRDQALQLQLDSAYVFLEDIQRLRTMNAQQLTALRDRLQDAERHRALLIESLP